MFADQSLDSQQLGLVDPGNVAEGNFERLPCDDLIGYRASQQAVMRVDLGKAVRQALLDVREPLSQCGVLHGVGQAPALRALS